MCLSVFDMFDATITAKFVESCCEFIYAEKLCTTVSVLVRPTYATSDACPIRRVFRTAVHDVVLQT